MAVNAPSAQRLLKDIHHFKLSAMNYKLIIIASGLLLVTASRSFAQEQPNPTHPTPTQPNAVHPNTPVKSPQQGNKKDDFVQKLNEFQPRMNDMIAKAKDNEAKLPDFSKEVNKLNDMVADFKNKLDKYDITQRDQQDDYASTLESEWQAIDAQYNKANEMWLKNPDDQMKEKTPAEKQIPPK